MKLLYVDKNEYQIGMSEPYHYDRTIEKGDTVRINGKKYKIKGIKIFDHYIMVEVKKNK